MGWQDERKSHDIVMMSGNRLLCSCGRELEVPAKEAGLSLAIRQNILLDRYLNHKKIQEKKGK